MSFTFADGFESDLKKLEKENIKLLAKTLKLIVEIEKYIDDPLEGLGNPELLKNNLQGLYSRRINQKHRLTYKIKENKQVLLLSCYGHYGDK